MNWHHEASAVCVTGKKGTGKTTKFLELLKKHRAKWKFVFDPQTEVARKMKWPVCETVEQMVAAVKAKKPICFYPWRMFAADEEGKKAALSFFCRWVYQVSCQLNGVKLLSIDEVQKYTKTHLGGVPAPLIEIMDTGRREEIDTLFICNKGLNKLSEEIRAQLTELYVFQTSSAASLKFLEEDFSKDELQKIRSLSIGQFLHTKV